MSKDALEIDEVLFNCLAIAGGGYTKNNVARCWTYETAVLVGEELDENIPQNTYQEYYQPDYKLNSTMTHTGLQNVNKKEDIDQIRETAMEYLRHLTFAPGVVSHLPLIKLYFCCRYKSKWHLVCTHLWFLACYAVSRMRASSVVLKLLCTSRVKLEEFWRN